MTKSIIKKDIDWGQKKSPWIMYFNGGACKGCESEALDAAAPRFDMERFGMRQTSDPSHADILICTGAVTLQTKEKLRLIYEQMPEPKLVIAAGACACSGGIFEDCYCVCGGIDSVIPVEAYVPGCAANPEAIIDAVNMLISARQEEDDPEDTEREER